MALSDPDRPGLDPKAHLPPSLSDLNIDHSPFESVFPILLCPPRLPSTVLTTSRPSPQQHNYKDPTPDSTAAKNESAHQQNSIANVHDFATPPTNGIHSSSSPLNNTQSSFEIQSSVTGSIDTVATTTVSPPSTKNLVPDETALSAESQIQAEPADPILPVPQQPLSDTRSPVQPQIMDNALDTVASDMRTEPLRSAPSTDSALADENPSSSGPYVSALSSETAAADNHASLGSPNEGGLPAPEVQPPLSGDVKSTANESENLKKQAEVTPSSSSPTDGPSLVAERSEQTVLPGTVPPDESLHTQNAAEDQIMSDAPPPATKTGRAREEDEAEDAPAAKRSKTEEEAQGDGFKIPDRPQIDTTVASHAHSTQSSPSPMTKPRQKHLQKTISNIKRIQAAKPFLVPVDTVALKIPTYYDIIKRPMDLKTLEENLRTEKYSTVDALVTDFNQIVQNAQAFNGDHHPVTLSAFSMRESFEKGMAALPSAEVSEVGLSKKKAPDPMPVRPPQARRESRSSLPGSARSPGSATSPQTFALGPEGVPLIRRDSTIDGRPKREIHKPAPKDLPYTNQKPKKKKFQRELKFCDHVLKEISKQKYTPFYYPFSAPVDPVALNIPNYLSIVKKPMDFGTMRQRLDRGEYENAKEFEADARLVFKNCYLFNPENDPIHRFGKQLEAVFNEEWSKKREWLEENTPSSGQRSPASSGDEESDEEDDDDDEDDVQLEIVSKLQKQIAEMSKQVEMITSGAKKKTPPTVGKKAAKPPKAVKKEIKKPAPAPSKADKKGATKTAKKDKAPYVTYEQKQDISNRINSLTETKMTQALAIIRNNMPTLKGVQEDEIELDIDELSNDVLYKLLLFVRKNAPRPEDQATPTAALASTAAPARKKNKPMTKHEQEARIAQVQSGLSAFQKGVAGNSRTYYCSLSSGGNANPSSSE